MERQKKAATQNLAQQLKNVVPPEKLRSAPGAHMDFRMMKEGQAGALP